MAIAEAEGARVLQHADVLPRYGSYRGKGEALWKSLYATSGDLVAWSDTDIRDWHPRFLYGTLGPLLAEPRIGYVKAYYQRPIVQDGVITEGGGGRVTELVARPLINLFFPELSGMIQPLSGEYAGRREHLEQIAFFTGYAVEIGHLIDLSDRLGLAGLGQVDLDIRFHRNQELEGLSKMSFVILQAVMKRLEERRKVRLFAELGSTMKLPRSAEIAVPGGHRPRGRRAPADAAHPRVPREARPGRGSADGAVARPRRARFVQGIAVVRGGGARAGRGLVAGAAGRRGGAGAARGRRRGHARCGRGGRRLGARCRRPRATR